MTTNHARGAAASGGVWAFVIGLLLLVSAGPCQAQTVTPRGLFTPVFNPTSSNTFINYALNRIECSRCGTMSADLNVSVFADIHVFLWVSKTTILGAKNGIVAGLPVSKGAMSLTGRGVACNLGVASETSGHHGGSRHLRPDGEVHRGRDRQQWPTRGSPAAGIFASDDERYHFLKAEGGSADTVDR